MKRDRTPTTTGTRRKPIQACASTREHPDDTLLDYILIGRRRYPFTSFAEASQAYMDAIEATGATISGRTGPPAPHCVFMKRYFDEDYCVGHVSYNGNVWIHEPHDIADPKLHRLAWSPAS